VSRTYRNVKARWVFDRETKEMVQVPVDYRERMRAPAVHQDSMDATRHPCDGRLYDSKSTFRRVTREHGCVEIGNEFVGPSEPVRYNMSQDDYAAEAKKAYEQVRSGTAPLTEYDREICKRINERIRNRA